MPRSSFLPNGTEFSTCSPLIDGISMRCVVPKVNAFGFIQPRERMPHGPRTVRRISSKIQGSPDRARGTNQIATSVTRRDAATPQLGSARSTLAKSSAVARWRFFVKRRRKIPDGFVLIAAEGSAVGLRPSIDEDHPLGLSSLPD